MAGNYHTNVRKLPPQSLLKLFSLRDSTSVDSSLSNWAMKRNPPNELQLDELRPGDFSLEIPMLGVPF